MSFMNDNSRFYMTFINKLTSQFRNRFLLSFYVFTCDRLELKKLILYFGVEGSSVKALCSCSQNTHRCYYFLRLLCLGLSLVFHYS